MELLLKVKKAVEQRLDFYINLTPSRAIPEEIIEQAQIELNFALQEIRRVERSVANEWMQMGSQL